MAKDEVEESLEVSLFHPEGTDRLVHFLDYLKLQEGRKLTSQKYLTGLSLLDASVDGFSSGELIVVTGPTGNGKTLFADSIGQRLMRHAQVNVAWFSFEVPAAQMLEKYQAAEDHKSLGLYVPIELKVGDFKWLKNKCLEARVRHGCHVIIIDHLHFLVDMDTNQNMSLNIGAVMRRIKQEIAIAMNLVVFIIAHQGQKKEGEPSIDNIRDSSFIGQEADMVFVVFRTADPVPPELEQNAKIKGYPVTFDDGFCIVKVEKSRRTGVFKKRLKYQKQGDWLEEVL